MVSSLHIAASGMQSNQQKVDSIANNLANMNTDTFKAGHASFADLAYIDRNIAGNTVAEGGSSSSASMQVGLGSRVAAIVKDFSQGPAVSNPNDKWSCMIEGEGFIAVTLPDGNIAYTRDLKFAPSSTGALVTLGGYAVNPAIQIPIDTAINIEFASNGRVVINNPDNAESIEAGVIPITRFINPGGLRAIGNNLYVPTEASGPAIVGDAAQNGFGSIRQFFTEGSNTESVKEIVDMINAQRGYDFCAKCLKAAEEMSKTEVQA